MKRQGKAMLLSGLVFPGLGQIYLGRRKSGLVISFSVLGLLLGLLVRIFVLVWRELVVEGFAGGELNLSRESFSRLHHQAWAGNWWLILIIALVWMFSVVEAGRG